MEINVTNLCRGWLLQSDDYNPPIDFSCSRYERGDYAGRGAWQAAVDEAPDYIELTDDEVSACKEWLGDFGAWERDEIAAWSTDEVAALLLQFIAGNWRNVMERDDAPTNLAEYQSATENDGGELYPTGDDFATCEWFFYAGC